MKPNRFSPKILHISRPFRYFCALGFNCRHYFILLCKLEFVSISSSANRKFFRLSLLEVFIIHKHLQMDRQRRQTRQHEKSSCYPLRRSGKISSYSLSFSGADNSILIAGWSRTSEDDSSLLFAKIELKGLLHVVCMFTVMKAAQ